MNILPKYFTVLITTILLLYFPSQAHAHFQDMEQSVTGILHVNPDDSPVVGEESTLVLFITDTKNNFSFETCQCTLVVTGPDNFEARTFLTRTGEARVTFPNKGVYKALFLGMSQEGSHLFDLNFDIRVERVTTQPSSTSSVHTPYLNLISLFILISAAIIYTFKDKIWKKQKKSR